MDDRVWFSKGTDSLLCATTGPWAHQSNYVFCFSWRYNPLWSYFHSPVASFSLLVFEVSWSHSRRATVGRTPLDEWSIRRRDLYLTTHNTHNRQTSIPPVGFEPTISAGERPKTYALDRAATGTGISRTMQYLTGRDIRKQNGPYVKNEGRYTSPPPPTIRLNGVVRSSK